VPTEPATVSASMATNQGNIGLQLDNAKAPCTVNSFASLAQKGFFNDTPCHRLTTSPSLAVLQCGDPTGQGTGGPDISSPTSTPPTSTRPDDPGLQQPVTYPRGTLAMANAGPDTNGSQFFLVYKDSQLPPNYTVFGTIDKTGLATLDKIAAAGVAGGGADGKPRRGSSRCYWTEGYDPTVDPTADPSAAVPVRGVSVPGTAADQHNGDRGAGQCGGVRSAGHRLRSSRCHRSSGPARRAAVWRSPVW
jgi:cyclophilin family peptidyl-prolyl cis-trans isomerase